jgi:hypothetical protein
MGKITYIYQTGVYPGGVEVKLDEGEKIIIASSSSGIKIYEKILIFPKLLWSCDTVSLIEKMFSLPKEFPLYSPLEVIANNIIDRFKSKQELVSFLTNFKV